MAEEKRTFDNDVRVLLSVSQLKSNRFRSTYQLSGLQRPCISRLHCRESNLSFYICMYSHIYVHKYIPTGWLLCRNGRPTQFVFLRSVNDSPFVTPFVYRPLRCETRQKRRRSAKRRVCVCIYIYTRVRTNQGNRKTLGVVCSGCHVSLSKSDLFVDHFRRNSIIFKIHDFTTINRL